MSTALPALKELQRLKRLDRTGWTLRGLPNGTESVAAPSFGVAVTSMLLADELSSRGVKVDVEKLLRIALLHDWAETRVGDMPRTASEYFGSENRKKAESKAFEDIVSCLKSRVKSLELHDEYERRGSLESKLVKAADILDLLVQVLALERAGARGLDEFWEVTQSPGLNLEDQGTAVVNEFIESVLEARSRLNT